METKHHATLPPSSYPAWAKCPHWTAKPAGDEATVGTAQHALLAAAMQGEIDIDTYEDASSDLLYPVRRAVHGIKELCERTISVAEYQCEQSVHAPHLPDAPFGTADVIALSNGNKDGTFDVCIVDYKSFFTNKSYWEQIAFYAVAYCGNDKAFKNIHLIVWYGDTGTYEYKLSSLAECQALAVHAIGNRLAKETLDRSPSPWCSLCAECGKCAKAFQLVEKSQALIVPEPERFLRKEQIPQLLAICTEVEKRIKGFKEYAKSVAEQQGGVIYDNNGQPAYEITSYAKSNIDIKKLFETTKTMITPDEMLQACMLEKTKARALLKGRPYMGRTIKMKEVDDIIAAASVKGELVSSLRKVRA